MTKPTELTRSFNPDLATGRTTLLVQVQQGDVAKVQQTLQGIPQETNPYEALAQMTAGTHILTATILPPEPQQG